MNHAATILIVEDNPGSLMLATVSLESDGYTVIGAESAEEARAVLGQRTPDIILMDIQLPGMNGIDALIRLRADGATRRIPVMAVTASAMTQDRQKILAAGFDAYQSKPIDVKGFLALVAQLLAAGPREAAR